MYGGLAAVGLGFLFLLYLLIPKPAAPLTAGEVASTYTQRSTGRFTAAAKAEPDQALEQAKDAATKVLQRNTSLEAKIAARLEGAGSQLKPAEWLLVHAGIFTGAGVVGLLFGQGSLVFGMLFLIAGAVIPWVYLGFKRGRRRKAFSSSLPDTLQLMSGSLSAGLSLAQAVDTVVREGTDPISDEFKRVLIETRLGVGLQDALEGVAVRYESKDFHWVVMAINIQRQVGGNLAELLDTVAATMREREYMRRQVAALAAEGKLSAWVLGGLPPAFVLYLLVAKRDYVMPMFTEPMGWLMLGGACCLLGLGIFWMSRLIKVEV
jgi:tight adherence protein B